MLTSLKKNCECNFTVFVSTNPKQKLTKHNQTIGGSKRLNKRCEILRIKVRANDTDNAKVTAKKFCINAALLSWRKYTIKNCFMFVLNFDRKT